MSRIIPNTLLILLVPGCSLVTETGYLSDAFTLDRVGREPLEAVITSTRVDAEVLPWLSLGAGASWVQPTDGKGEAVMFDIVGTIRGEVSRAEPYFQGGTGFFQSVTRWGEQGTRWGFPLWAAVGVRYEPEPGSSVSMSYRHWHQSNGSKVFGHGEDNPGLESGGFFLSYEVELP